MDDREAFAIALAEARESGREGGIPVSSAEQDNTITCWITQK